MYSHPLPERSTWGRNSEDQQTSKYSEATAVTEAPMRCGRSPGWGMDMLSRQSQGRLAQEVISESSNSNRTTFGLALNKLPKSAVPQFPWL